MTPCAIIDIDGTLADVSGVRHYVLDDPRRKDFAGFHGAASYVRPHEQVVAIAQGLQARGIAVVVLTSRREQWRYRTKVWLGKWEVPYSLLGMRSDTDNRRDDAVKRDLLAGVRARGYEPVLAVDDNPQVVALWREEAIPTVVVPGWV